MVSWVSGLRCLAAALLLVGAHGCRAGAAAGIADAGAPGLSVAHHTGGTDLCTLVSGETWYQTSGSTLLVLRAAGGDLVTEVPLAGPGGGGPAADMVIDGSRMLVALRRDSVVELDLGNPRKPVVVTRAGREELGVAPLRVTAAAGDLYVSGAGGVVRWSDRALLLSGPHDYEGVVETADGLVVCGGRRAFRIDGGVYVGSASDLVPLPPSFGLPGVLVFHRRGVAGTAVGLMSGDLRELDAFSATVRVDGDVHRLRTCAGRVWIVTDRGITGYAIRDGALGDPVGIEFAGARDIDTINPSLFAVSGCAGRAIVRWSQKRDSPRVAIGSRHETPGCLLRARCDGRFILAGGDHGSWLYEIGGSARPSDLPTGELPPPSTRAVTVRATAEVDAGGRTVTIATGQGVRRHEEPEAVHCVAIVAGRVWVGHDLGVTVLALDGTEVARPPVTGPVRYLFPLLSGDGVAYVSQHGGFGVVGYFAFEQ